MKEKRKEKYSSKNKHKTKKKHKKKYDSSDDSDSSDDNMQWIEASSLDTNKKMKKKKHKKRKHQSSSSSDSESPVEENSKTGSSPPSTPAEKRESWMNEESFVPTLSKDEMYLSSRQKRMDSMKEQREKEEIIQNERELNPYLKKDRTGLPEKETKVESLSLPSTSVGDGGYSWLKKAYYRIQEQAQQEGRSMEEVAVERWGSLSKLTSLIEEAEERMKSHPDFKHSRNRYNDTYHNRSSKSHFKKPNDVCESERRYDSPFKFKKPTDDSKNRNIVNQFKSSKKSDYANYDDMGKWKRHEDSASYKDLPEEKSAMPDKPNLKLQKSDDSNNEIRIPAWKKPKYLVEKPKEPEMSSDCQVHISHSSEEDVKKDTSEEGIMPVIYSDDDLSKIAAKQLKAEIMGNDALAQELKNQLEEARKIVKERGFAKQPSKKVEEVILTKLDSQGQARPVQTTQEKVEDYKHKRSNKFFDDGSRYSLKQMFESEKLKTADDQIETFVEAYAHSNETAEIDYESGHISKKLSKKLSATHDEEKDIGKAIQQHQKLTSALERCGYCLDQPHMKKHLIVDIGEQIYLCLPNFQALAEGHCLIVPKTHVSSFLSLDENEWKEVIDFKNQLRCMFRSDGKSVIFLETSMNFRHYPHAVIECIPVPKEEGDMAPFYFKKAIQESESEWAHNKKLIDLTKKGLRHSVPKNLPYFHVEFDPQIHAGYAHVIEDEKYFPRNFGKEVVGGMLDIDYYHLYKNKKEDPLKKTKDVVDFGKLWKKFKDVQ